MCPAFAAQSGFGPRRLSNITLTLTLKARHQNLLPQTYIWTDHMVGSLEVSLTLNIGPFHTLHPFNWLAWLNLGELCVEDLSIDEEVENGRGGE